MRTISTLQQARIDATLEIEKLKTERNDIQQMRTEINQMRSQLEKDKSDASIEIERIKTEKEQLQQTKIDLENLKDKHCMELQALQDDHRVEMERKIIELTNLVIAHNTNKKEIENFAEASKKEITVHHQKIVQELRARRDRCVRKITKKEKHSTKALRDETDKYIAIAKAEINRELNNHSLKVPNDDDETHQAAQTPVVINKSSSSSDNKENSASSNDSSTLSKHLPEEESKMLQSFRNIRSPNAVYSVFHQNFHSQ